MTGGGAYTRADMYRRILHGLDGLREKKFRQEVEIWPDDKPITFTDGTVMTVGEVVAEVDHILKKERPRRVIDIQQTLDRLKVCPVCTQELTVYPDEPMARSCECGQFVMTQVYSDGDVTFEFRMIAAPEESDG